MLPKMMRPRLVKAVVFMIPVIALASLLVQFASPDRGNADAAELPRNVRQELAKRFGELDRDTSETLSVTELGKPIFEFLNANGDAEVTLDEVYKVVEQKGLPALQEVVAKQNQPAPPSDKPLTPVRQGPQRLVPGDSGVGRMFPALPFTTVDGNVFRLDRFRDAKAIVIAFTNVSCPICKKYTPSLADYERKYAARGVSFIYVNPTASDKRAAIEKTIGEHKLQGPYVLDHDHAIARALKATHTTDVFVLDTDRTVVYRGAVDDQYGFGYSLDAPRQSFLASALDATLEGKRPRIAATEAPGCPLDLKEPSKAESNEITYHNQVARILQNHCVQCHRDGGVAPFGLEDFASVDGQSGSIRRVIEDDLMPPWFAAKPQDGTPSRFINDCSLSDSDKTTLLTWLDAGKPEGNPNDAPKPRTFSSEWQIGEPDLVLQLPEPIAVKASGTMPYQNVTIETNFTEDRYVSAIEVMPMAREVVHHCLVFVLPPKGNDASDQRIGESERDGFFAAYAPGYDAMVFNEGFGKMIPAGSRLKFQLHYTPNGSATADQTKVGFIFAKEPPAQLVNVAGIAQPRLAIPPGAENHEVVASVTLPQETTIHAFFPHMHLRGKAFRYEALSPDGRSETLLDIPRYDFNWQLSYRLAEPLTFPAGTKIQATAWYDNSKNNPANPDPTRTVTWGEQTFDEMMIGYVEYHSEEGRVSQLANGPLGTLIRNLGSGENLAAKFREVDTNDDGKLSREELEKANQTRLLRLDRDGDGSLSLDEAKQLLKLLRSSR